MAVAFFDSATAFFQYVHALTYPPTERGIINPCSFSLIADVTRDLTGHPDLSFIVYPLWVGLVLGVFWVGLRALSWEKDKRTVIFLSVLTYALSVPRFKDYSYVLIIPVAYGMIWKNIQLIFPPFFGIFGFLHRKKIYFDAYFPFFAMLIFWMVLVYQILVKPVFDGRDDREK